MPDSDIQILSVMVVTVSDYASLTPKLLSPFNPANTERFPNVPEWSHEVIFFWGGDQTRTFHVGYY